MEDFLLPLNFVNCPRNIAGVKCHSFLSFWEAFWLTREQVSLYSHRKRVFFKVSCMGPIRWLLVAYILFSEFENKMSTWILTFADGFNFISVQFWRLDFKASSGIPNFCHLMESLHLQLSIKKSQTITFAKPYKNKLTKKKYDTCVHYVSNLKRLGLLLGKT